MTTERMLLVASVLWAAVATTACAGEDGRSEPVTTAMQPIVAGIYQLETSDGSCVAVSGASLDNGADIVPATCNDGPEQRWRFVMRPEGTFRIRNVGSGKCMRAAGSTNVQQGRCVYKRSKWWTHEDAAGQVRLESRKTERCARANGTIEQTPCAINGPLQQFVTSQPCTMCGTECVDLATDASNCGTCGNVCLNGPCLDGACLGCVE